MSDDEIYSIVKEIHSKNPQMKIVDIWYYNLDYYQISFKKAEKIYNLILTDEEKSS